MDRIRLVINGRQVAANRGSTILEVALENDIYIPHLCYYPTLKPRGACRLCIVEVNSRDLVAACRTPAEAGMVVNTDSPEVDKVVRPIVELLIADHHASCRGCPSSGRCALQKIIAHFRIDRKRVRRLRLPREEMSLDTSNPVFDYDPNRCVLCGICLQTCEATQGVSLLYYVGRGYGTTIAFFGDSSRCESCGECVARCPVGALIPKSAR